MSLTPGLGRSPAGGRGNPLFYSCLKKSHTEEPERLQSMGSQRVGNDFSDWKASYVYTDNIESKGPRLLIIYLYLPRFCFVHAWLPWGIERDSLRHPSQVDMNINISTATRGKLHVPHIVPRWDMIPCLWLKRWASFPQAWHSIGPQNPGEVASETQVLLLVKNERDKTKESGLILLKSFALSCNKRKKKNKV